MSDSWFILDDRGRVGPFTYSDLVPTIATYPDPEEVLVKRDGQKSWQRAGDIAGLVQKIEPIAAEYKPITPERIIPNTETSYSATHPQSAAQRWVVWGALVGLVIGVLGALGNTPHDNFAYLLAIVVGSASATAGAAFLIGLVADWMSRPKKSQKLQVVAPTKLRRWNLVATHWRGQYPLWISYWVINFVVGIFASILAVAITAVFQPESGYDPIFVFGYESTIWLCVVALTIWQIVGVWRSANNHIVRRAATGKRAPWAGLTKLALVFMGIQSIAVFLQNGLPQLSESVRIAFMGDPEIPAYSFRIMHNGTEVEITGGFKYGLTDDFQKLISASRQIRVVHLTSLGGRIGEAEKLYELIRADNLITYVPSECASACTLAFAAGRQRYIAPNAILGFHAPSFPGIKENQLNASIAEQSKLFIQSGFAPSFVSRALETPASSLWRPTITELYAGKAITRVSNGNEFAVSGLGDVSKASMGLFLAKAIPVLEALRENNPKSYNLVVDSFYGSYVAGQTQTESIESVRTKLAAIMGALRVTADDTVLTKIAHWYADAYRALANKNVVECYMFASGRDANSYRTYLPSELIKLEDELNVEVIKTSSHRAPAEPAMVADAWKTLFSLTKIYKLSDADLDLIETASDVPPSKYVDFCRATVAFYNAIAALPPTNSGIVMRQILAAPDDPSHR